MSWSSLGELPKSAHYTWNFLRNSCIERLYSQSYLAIIISYQAMNDTSASKVIDTFDEPIESYSDVLEINQLDVVNSTLLSRKIDLLFINGIDSKSLLVEIKLSNFETDTCHNAFVIFRKLSDLKLKGLPISVNWYYELDNEEVRSGGSDLGEIFKLDLRLINQQEI